MQRLKNNWQKSALIYKKDMIDHNSHTAISLSFPPKDWVETILGEVIFPVSESFNFKNIKKVHFLNTGDILKGKLLHNNLSDVSILPGQAKKAFKINDILFSEIRPANKRYVLVNFDSSNSVASTKLMVLRAKNNININFIYKLITSNDILQEFQSIAESRSGTFPQITFESIKNFPLYLPPLPEQRAIASVLSAFDDKIELLREQNKTLEDIGQTIFQGWFGKYSVEKPEELPEGYRVGKITEVINREPVPYKCDKKDLDLKGKTPIIDQGADGLYGYTSREPDFIATKEKPVILFTNHTCNFWFIDYSFCAIQNVLPYRGKDGYDEYFLYFMTKGSITFIEYKGHWPNFVAKDFVIPPVEIAQNFSKIAKPILEKISDNNSQIQSLARSRDEIMPKLISGIIRVNDFNSN
jgi:type I restriction enzyme, S subunit